VLTEVHGRRNRNAILSSKKPAWSGLREL